MNENFSTKEIVMMIQEEKEARLELTKELELTRQYMKKYNGLIDKIGNHGDRIRALEDKVTEGDGKLTLWDSIRQYSVWIIGLITFGYWLAQILGIAGR